MKHSLLTTLFLAFLFAYGFPSPLQSNELIKINGIYYDCNGKYYIEKDEKGVYLRTDKDLSWYLDEDDLGVFKLGESGFYFLETNASTPYIITDKKRGFYINQKAAENIKKERGSSVTDYEPIQVISGFDSLFTNEGIFYYDNRVKAIMGVDGRPKVEWERKKRAEEAARIKAEREAIEERRIKAEEEARWDAEWERQKSERAREEAEWARQELERERQEAEEQTRKSYTYGPFPEEYPQGVVNSFPEDRPWGAVNPYTGEYYPSTGDGGLIRPQDGTYFAPAGPGGVVNTRTGEFVPTGP